MSCTNHGGCVAVASVPDRCSEPIAHRIEKVSGQVSVALHPEDSLC